MKVMPKGYLRFIAAVNDDEEFVGVERAAFKAAALLLPQMARALEVAWPLLEGQYGPFNEHNAHDLDLVEVKLALDGFRNWK